MQKIEHLNRLRRLFAVGIGFCIAALLFVVVGSLHAGEPAMTLAMNQPSESSSGMSSLGLTANTGNQLSPFKTSHAESVSLNDEKAATIPPAYQMEKETNSSQPESFPLVREDSHPTKPVSVQAGYGRIWDDQSTLQKIVTDHQEPSCAYVSANFSF